MVTPLCFFLTLLASPFKSKTRLEAENAALRHQLIVLQRKVRGRVHFTNSDRLFFIQLYRWFPSVLRLRFQSNAWSGQQWLDAFHALARIEIFGRSAMRPVKRSPISMRPRLVKGQLLGLDGSLSVERA